MTIEDFLESPLESPLGFLTAVFVLVAVLVGLVLVLDGSDGGKAPADWNPNQSCRIHRGVQQVSSSDEYIVAVVCKDGTFIPNPYD